MSVTLFPSTLLHAIDRWQIGGDHKAKEVRGKRLKREVLTLNDSGLHRCTEVVYRRLGLGSDYIWTFITTGALPEAISGWTFDAEIAKGFKGGVPEEWKDGKRWFGVILSHKPHPEEVVLNLDSLWVDMIYQRSLSKAGPAKYTKGIRRYENSQKEVVLDVKAVSLKSVFSWGGYSSPMEQLAEMAVGSKPTQEQIEWLRKLMNEHGLHSGAQWLPTSGAREVTLRVLEHARSRGLPVPSDPAFLP